MEMKPEGDKIPNLWQEEEEEIERLEEGRRDTDRPRKIWKYKGSDPWQEKEEKEKIHG